MSFSDGPAGPGGATLFWLSAVILGGLLFAAGVMVGRGMAPGDPQGPADPLAHLDERDQGPAPKVDDELTYPDALSGPPKPAPARSDPKPAPTPRAPANPQPAEDAGSMATVRADGADARPDRAEPDSSTASYCLQVASFRTRQQADDLATRLEGSGLPDVRTVSGEVEGKGMHYRVRLGRFTDREAAERFRHSNDLKGLIIRAE